MANTQTRQKEYYHEALMEQDGWPDCPYCEEPFYYRDGHIDHILPACAGGTSCWSNTILVCPDCNKSKSTKRLEYWCIEMSIAPEGVRRRLEDAGKRYE